MNPFDFLKTINDTKQNILYEDPLLEKDYQPFITNRTLSYHRDSLFFANEMNKYGSQLSNRMQYEFYLYSIPKGKRFAKWEKAKKPDDVLLAEYIMIEYKMSRHRAEEAIKLLTADQKHVIIDSYRKGGQSKTR